jgi:hypothetical protein
VSDVLGSADVAACAPDNADDADNDQGAPDPLLGCECLSQDRRCQQSDDQRRDTRKQSARMGSGSEQQAGIREQDHRRSATSHDGRQSGPPEAFKRETLMDCIGQ